MIDHSKNLCLKCKHHDVGTFPFRYDCELTAGIPIAMCSMVTIKRDPKDCSYIVVTCEEFKRKRKVKHGNNI